MIGEWTYEDTSDTARHETGSTSERAFQEYLAILLREKWTIVITTFLIVAGAVLFTKMSDPVFQSTCQVILSREAKGNLFVDQNPGELNKTTVQNELAVLNSRSLADSVAKRLFRQRYFADAKGGIIPSIVISAGGITPGYCGFP